MGQLLQGDGSDSSLPIYPKYPKYPSCFPLLREWSVPHVLPKNSLLPWNAVEATALSLGWVKIELAAQFIPVHGLGQRASVWLSSSNGLGE